MSGSLSGNPFLGSTGHWPVPPGDSPTGTCESPVLPVFRTCPEPSFVRVQKCSVLISAGASLRELNMDDAELLQTFAEGGAEDAFKALVDRHIRLVYFATRRPPATARGGVGAD